MSAPPGEGRTIRVTDLDRDQKRALWAFLQDQYPELAEVLGTLSPPGHPPATLERLVLEDLPPDAPIPGVTAYEDAGHRVPVTCLNEAPV